MTRYSQTPVTQPPPPPAGSRDTLMVEEESLILQQVGDANKAETGPRETTKFGGRAKKKLPKNYLR